MSQEMLESLLVGIGEAILLLSLGGGALLLLFGMAKFAMLLTDHKSRMERTQREIDFLRDLRKDLHDGQIHRPGHEKSA